MVNNNLLNGNAILGIQSAKESFSTSLERLSSGSKINKASDDPAGLVISQQMKAEIAGIEKEIQGLESQSSKLQVADGYMGSLSDNLMEMRSIAVEAANGGTLDDAQKQALQQAMDSSVKEFNKTTEDASFGKQKLLDGSEGSEADIEKMASMDLSTPEKAEEAVSKIDEMIAKVSDARGEVGARESEEIDSQLNNLRISMQNLMQAQSEIKDTDYALEFGKAMAEKIKMEASAAMEAHGNMVGEMVMSMISSPANSIGV